MLAAEELKYVSGLKRAIADQFDAPSEELVRLLTSKVYEGSFTQKVREPFTRLTTKALAQFISDSVNDRLKSALGGAAPAVGAAPEHLATPAGASSTAQDDAGLITTLEEVEGFQIVRAIVASEVPFSRVVARDQKSYFGILLDDNNRKPVCRLHFNHKQRYIGLFDADKVERREPLGAVEEIYHHADELREAVRRYM